MNSHAEFREALQKERENLIRLSDYWDAHSKCDAKDTQGRIRAAVGKTRLLLSEKIKQFEGLVEQSENKTSEKEISMNDLQGFWDLVLIQVNEVKEMFRILDPSKCRDLDSAKEVTKVSSMSKTRSSNDSLEQVDRKIKESEDLKS